MKRSLAALALLPLFAFVGCSAEPASESSVPPAAEQAQAPEENKVEGTQANPLPFGTPVEVGDWTITINSWQPNMNDQVEAAGGDLSMLESGMQYALLNVTMTWNGEGTGDNSLVSIQYFPDRGNTVSDSWSAFGKTPGDNKLAYEKVVSGGSVTGDMLYTVDEGNASGVFGLGAPGAETVVYVAAQ